MGLVVAQGSTAWNSADAATTTYAIDLSGSGFSASEPLKAIIVFANAQADAADATASADIKVSVGVATGTAARGCAAGQSDDGAGASATDRVMRTDCVATFVSTAGADAGRLDISVFGDDDFTFIVDVAVPSNRRVHWVALGGSDFDVAAVGTFSFTSDTTGTQDVTVTGFEASPATADQCVLILSTGSSALDTVTANFGLSIGVGAGSSPTNYLAGITSQDAQDPTDTSSYALSGESSATVGASQAVFGRSDISAWGADKFVYNRTEAEATDRVYLYLAMKGPLFQVGDFTIPTDTNAFSETSFGFQPKGALFVGCGRAASTADTATVHAELSIGFAANATDQRCVSVYDQDAAATTDCDHSVQYGDIAVAWTSGGGTLDAAVALDSFDSGGMTLHATNAAGASGKFVWYLAIGPVAATADYTGSSAGTGTPSATLTALASYTGSAAGTGTPSAALNGATAYAASSAGVATASAALDAATSYAATSAGVGAASGEMTALASYVGTAAGTGTPSATLAGVADYACSSAGVATCTGAMTGSADLVGLSAGVGYAAAGITIPQEPMLEPKPEARRALALELLRRRQH